MRIVTATGNNAVYCFIPNGTFNAVDNQQSVRYVDSNCAIQVAEFSNYFDNLILAGNVWDFSALTCHGGVCEVFKGGSIENRRNGKTRVEAYNFNHLKVIDGGMNFYVGTRLNFSISSGKYQFIMTPVNTPLLNSTTSLTEYWYHNGTSSDWTSTDLQGLNLAQCDNGTALVTCTGNNYRRYFIYIVGWNQTGHYPTELVY
jgi:hypothetical protein